MKDGGWDIYQLARHIFILWLVNPLLTRCFMRLGQNYNMSLYYSVKKKASEYINPNPI